jgi:hypothetical protein
LTLLKGVFNEEVLQNFINRLKNERDLSARTIRSAYGIVCEVLKTASRKNAFDVSILSEISLPRENKVVRAW